MGGSICWFRLSMQGGKMRRMIVYFGVPVGVESSQEIIL